MTTPVDQDNWQAAIHYVIQAALPNEDYQVVCFHQSKSSESLYVDVLLENYLFQLRFAFHDHDDHNPHLHSFNLRAFPHDQKLITAIAQILRKRRNGVALTYHHFVTLSLVEKLGQFSDTPLTFQNGLFADHNQLLKPSFFRTSLEFLWQHQLLLLKRSTQQVFLSDSGTHLLDYYWDVADQYLEDPSWDDNPRTHTPEELRNLLEFRN